MEWVADLQCQLQLHFVSENVALLMHACSFPFPLKPHANDILQSAKSLVLVHMQRLPPAIST